MALLCGCTNDDGAPGGHDLGGNHDGNIGGGPNPDLAGADFAGADFSGVDFANTANHDFAGTTQSGHVSRVFIILMENSNWSNWKGSSSAPYINKTLLPIASHAEMYFNPPGNHPSLPNYLWLEAGSNLGVTADGEPSSYHQSTTDHLVTQLENAGHTWKSYVENIDGTTCPLTDSGLFATRHVPALFFDDVTNTNDANAARCKNHVVPYSQLQTDLQNNSVADYNFITPNLCDDAHGSNVLAGDFTCVAGITDLVNKGDTFLSTAVPMITGWSGFASGGVVFVAWDEGDSSSSDGPIGFIAVGQNVKGGGYASSVHFDHSSTLRSIEEIFGVPALRGAQTATDLSDLFTTFP